MRGVRSVLFVVAWLGARDAHAQAACTIEHRCVQVFLPAQNLTVDSLLGADSRTIVASIPGAFVAIDIGTGAITNSLVRGTACAYADRSILVGGTFYWRTQSGMCAASFGEMPRCLFSNGVVGNFIVASAQVFATVRMANTIELERVSTSASGGTPTLVETVNDGEPPFASNSRFVFWSSGGMIRYAAHAGSGSPMQLTRTNLGRARSIVANESSIFVATATAIVRVQIGNGATTVIVSHGADGLALDGSELYWFRTDVGDIGKIPAAGGADTTLASHYAPTSIAIGPSSVFFVQGRDDETVREIRPK